MRIAVYLDQGYRTDGSAIYAQRPFVLFLNRLAREFERTVLCGRLEAEPGEWPHRLAEEIEFVGLPDRGDGADPLGVGRAAVGAARTFASVLDGVDAVWLIGPQGLCLPFAAQAAAKRKPVILGVRQDLVSYIRNRRPGDRRALAVARALEWRYRRLARRYPVVAVGEELAARYADAQRVLELGVSLVDAASVVAPEVALERDYRGALRVLSVGRLDPEKNPLLLADVLAELRREDPRWELTVCGDGPLRGELRDRLDRLGVGAHARLAGHVPIDDGLVDLYRASHFLLHVSFTEGLPQVLFEAFASGLPVVATDVGGVAAAAGGAAELIPPADANAASESLRRLAADPERRAEMVNAGHHRILRRTIEAECRRLADFLRAAVPDRANGGPPR